MNGFDIKNNNNTLYLLWISPLSFFYAKGVYSVRLSREVPYQPFSDLPDIPPPPSLIVFYINFQPPLPLPAN